MGLRYSIMGFKQEAVLKLKTTIMVKTRKGEDEPKELSLDLNDLLLIKQIADFPNRKNILRMVVDGKEYYWVSYKEIINELPILKIKRQALADRLDKICVLGVLERYVDKSSSVGTRMFFRMGKNYESLIYDDASQPAPGVVDYDRGSSELRLKYNLIDNNKTSRESKRNSHSLESDNENGTKELSSVNTQSRLQDKKEKTKQRERTAGGCAPTEQEVRQFFHDRGFIADYRKFYLYYQARGWKDIEDWTALAEVWDMRENEDRLNSAPLAKAQEREERKKDTEYEEYCRRLEKEGKK